MPSNSVGGVSVSVHLDDRDAMQQLEKLKHKMSTLQDDLNAKKAQKSAVAEQLRVAGADADAARLKVEQLKSALATAAPGDRAGLRAQLSAANAELREQTSIVNKLDDQYVKLTNEISAGERDLTRMGSSTADLERQIAASSRTMAKLEDAAAHAAKQLEKVFSRTGNMIKRVFFFSAITRALRGIRTWFTDIIASNDEAAAAIGRFKGALLTLVQPLVEVIIPAITALVNALTKVVLALASFTSGLFGKTVQESAAAAESFQEEQKAIKGVGSAAKKASGQLAAFDQINKLAAEDAGGGASSEIEPTFDFDGMMAEDELNNILRIVEDIGAALLAWRLGRALGMDFMQMIGLALLFYNTIEFIKAFMDAWNNGINMDNLLDMLWALAGAAIGAGLAFGTVGAGIALLVGGLALLTVGFKDLYENGMDLENTLTIISGLFAGGLGLSLLTGSFVPLAIAALADLILWLVYTQGEGELFTEGIRDIFDGLGKFFKSVFAGDMEGAMEGLKQAWEGLKKVGQAVANAVQQAWQAFLEWTGRTLGPKWKAFFESIGNDVRRIIEDVKNSLQGLITFLVGAFTNDAQKVNDGLMQMFKGTANLVLGIVGGMVNVLIKGLNWLTRQMNKISFDVPDWVPGIGGTHVGINIPAIPEWQVPRLAQGAVIPPNREFMAILGDQKSGTNIEAPLETIVQAFRQAVREMNGGDQRVEVRVYLDSREIKAGQQRLSRVTGG